MAEDDVLRVDFGLRQGALALEVRFGTSAAWTCLFGASGSGKTTILRAIAGFIRPETGRIAVNGESMFDADGVCLAPHARPVRSAGQRAWLFPGTVRENAGSGVLGRARGEQVEDVLRRFRLHKLADTNVRRLSGGEAQRLSVARAVAAAVHAERRVKLLLLDEPFAGMDATLRDELALELREWLREREMPVLSVTHDVGEAFLLEAEVVRVADGRVMAQGPVGEVLRAERERFRVVLG